MALRESLLLTAAASGEGQRWGRLLGIAIVVLLVLIVREVIIKAIHWGHRHGHGHEDPGHPRPSDDGPPTPGQG